MKHPILGSKHLNYLDFKQLYEDIIKNKEHLNDAGLRRGRFITDFTIKEKNYDTKF